MRKNKITGLLIASLVTCISLGNVANAKVDDKGIDTVFVKEKINRSGNGYREIVTAKKAAEGKKLGILVTYMYDDEGHSAEDYKYSWFKGYNKSKDEESNPVKFTKGEMDYITFPSKVRTSDKVSVSAEGNSKNVSAKISGRIFYFHN